MSGRQVIQLGERYGRLTILEQVANDPSGGRQWRCRCDCGAIRIVRTGNLRNGHTQSCGCASAEHSAARHLKHGHARHWRVSVEFTAWAAMLDRCRNTNAPAFKDYGGRGIQVDPAWQESFAAFLAHIGPRPSTKHSLDRIDNNGNYEPGNVRWALKRTQNRNQRSNRQITYNGRTQSLAAWTDELGLRYRAVYQRLHRGATVEHAFRHR
jgi:hypothetical protein